MARKQIISLIIWMPLVLALTATLLFPVVTFVRAGVLPNAQQDSALLLLLARSDTWEVILRTVIFAVVCTAIQAALAVRIGTVTARNVGKSAKVALLVMPLLVGPATCAVLWKAVLDPFNGVAAVVAGLGDWRGLDWTANGLTAISVVAFVQVWIWSLAAGATVATLYDVRTLQVRNIILLDGGSARTADFWALWVMRRRWIILIGLALFVENLRAFEVIYVLTRGGPGSATEMLQWKIFETSFVLVDSQQSSAWAVLLLIMFQIALLPLMAALTWKPRNA